MHNSCICQQNINYVGLTWGWLGVRNWSRLPLPAWGGGWDLPALKGTGSKEQAPQETAPSPVGFLLAGAGGGEGVSAYLEQQPAGLSPRPQLTAPENQTHSVSSLCW